MTLDEILSRLQGMPPEQLAMVSSEVMKATAEQSWFPNPGPQTEAYDCEADELFYGGQAGGGKTDLMVGLSITQHTRSLLLRRTNKEAQGLVEAIAETLGHRNGYNGQDDVWRIGHRTIDIGGCQLEDDKQKYKGKPHDLIAFDEVSDFSETQYLFITTWNRSADPGQRCRIVACGNPPTRAEGLWVTKRWAAWLDPRHPNPAQAGEIRWYLRNENDEEIEVDGRGPFMVNGKPALARSRTFIPARLSDNPDLAATDYDAVLANLPAELRAAYRDGRFDISLQDEPFQCMPTTWVQDAMTRWAPNPPAAVPLCAMGVDVAQGGRDNTVIASRYDGWYAPLKVVAGSLTPTGPDVAGIVMAQRRDNAAVILDVGGGWGGEAYGHLRANGVDNAVAYMGVKDSIQRTADQQFKFKNVRTEAYWRFREALDPGQAGGSHIQLPDDRELLADLTAPRWTGKPGGVLELESKDKVVARLGRSPDRGDAVVMAWFSGAKMISDYMNWKAGAAIMGGRRSSRAKMGHSGARRR